MRKMMRLLLAMIVPLVLVLVLYTPALACTCVYVGPHEMYEAADAVFTGVVASKSIMGGSRITFVDVEFRVTGIWKGITTSTVHVSTSSSDASCGVLFIPAKEYLVYAFSDDVFPDVGWRTNLCTRTRRVEYAQEDFEVIGNPSGQPPVISTWGRIKILYEY
jgi:hypothetical protein